MKIIKKTEIPGARRLTPLEMNRMHFAGAATDAAQPAPGPQADNAAPETAAPADDK